jgi:biopolymer transport protein TolR
MEMGNGGRGPRQTLSQINVTPLVDVMLVLLIIFMVTAPMLQTGVDVNLPEVENAPVLPRKKEPLIVTVDKAGHISIGKTQVEEVAKLTPVIRQVLSTRENKAVFLEADREVNYGRVVEVLAAIRRAGVQRLGMVSREPET